MPERWALTYTNNGVTTGMFLPETRNFDPAVGLPDELPSVAITALRERYPLYYAQYLSNMEANYRNSRTDVEFDIATYGPDTNCTYPPRTDLGGGFALRRIAPTLCRPDERIEATDPVTNQPIKVVMGQDIVREQFIGDGEEARDEAWVDVDVSLCDCLAPPTYACIEVLCALGPYFNGDTCSYVCAPGCTGLVSTIITCNNGNWDGQVPLCQMDCPPLPSYTCIDVVCDPGPYNHGDTCSYVCAPGCTGLVSTLMTCNNGNWDGQVPLCQMDCPPLPSYPCIDVVCDPGPYNHGDTCAYVCAPGCTGLVSTLMTCNNGNWDGQVPLCQMDCPPPPSYPPCVNVVCAPGPYNHGDTCGYTCAPGCIGLVSTIITCNNGNWDGTVPNCQMGNCLAPPSYPPCVDVICALGPYFNGDTCSYVCAPGCTGLVSTIITCNNGNWDGQVPLCQMDCLPPQTYPCIGVTCASPAPYNHGDSCTYSCAPGCIGGSTSITCNHGYWIGQVPLCQMLCIEKYLPTEFDYEAAKTAITGSRLDPDVADEVGLDSFLTDLAAYAEYDGNFLVDLPNTDTIIIMPERWVLTYTNNGVTTGMFLDETRNFDPDVGLPDELPSVALAALRERYPQYYEQYLSNMEADYRNSRIEMEFDIATYGPDANCSYPPRTDLGGGFALRRIAPTLCRPDAETVARDPVTDQPIKVLMGQDIVWEQFIGDGEDVRDEAMVDVDVSRCDCLPPPSHPCIDVVCPPGPYFNGDTCGYTCARGCTGVISTIITCNNGNWDGQVPICNRDCPPLPDIPPCIVAISFSPPPYHHGATSGYTCAPGCIGYISTIMTCNDGNWDGIVPYCKKSKLK
ncbi:uncharacterized protein LOC144922176 [Branchiostoma floridae x Branchiostoma belcheri]